MGEGFSNSKYLLIFQTKIQVQMFHKKFNQNWIINEDFNILNSGEVFIGEIFQFRLVNYQLTIK